MARLISIETSINNNHKIKLNKLRSIIIQTVAKLIMLQDFKVKFQDLHLQIIYQCH